MTRCQALAAAWMLTACTAAYAVEPPTTDIPRVAAETYARLPALFEVALSANGDYIVAGQNSATGTSSALVLETARGTAVRSIEGRQYRRIARRDRLEDLSWASPHHVAYRLIATRPAGPVRPVDVSRAYRMGLMDIRTGRTYLVHQGGFRDNFVQLFDLIAPIEGDADSGRVVLPARQAPGNFSVYRVNLEDGTTRLQDSGSVDTSRFAFNAKGEAIARLDVRRDKDEWEIRSLVREDDPVIASGHSDLGQLKGFGSLPSGEVVVIDRLNLSATDVLYSINTGTGDTAVLIDDPLRDVAGTLTDPWQHHVVGAFVADDSLREVYLDDALQQVYDRVSALRPGASIHLASWTADRSRFAVYIETAGDVGGYFLFDVKTGQLGLIGWLNPELNHRNHLGDRQAITYPARDGARIPAVLTLPIARGQGRLPLVVLSAGYARQPARMESFWLASFLASRGYAVIEPNERGTVGYGHAWEVAGDGQWGRRMSDDLEDAVTALERAGMIDAHNVCSVGIGDGAYSALRGASRSPERYRCAVGINGIFDLPRYVIYIRLRTDHYSTLRLHFDRLIGTDVKSNSALKSLSPVHQAGDLQAAVLLIHHERGTETPLEQSQAMASALRRADKPVELITLPDEDHTLREPQTRLRVLQALESFLGQHLHATPVAESG